jgi:hypothetical protein
MNSSALSKWERGKLLAALADFHCPFLIGPRINVLKQMAVEGK